MPSFKEAGRMNDYLRMVEFNRARLFRFSTFLALVTFLACFVAMKAIGFDLVTEASPEFIKIWIVLILLVLVLGIKSIRNPSVFPAVGVLSGFLAAGNVISWQDSWLSWFVASLVLYGGSFIIAHHGYRKLLK